ncbi:adenine nucleotide alpha hydrolases-like protein [Ascobolus immersus RN42]|uniref:Diphthine--ammonia ligase n=1 Tax=Ascobolus immersus RN42 TaxID=1160509 RepID=A0A3N4IEY6_ASCIM|nr:adenine nucleotide alpha hydrolases-like protein [Ascobolus immersus RN42]
METIALVSGGKDSFLSILHSLRSGHRIIAIANLYPPSSPLLPNSDPTTGVQTVLPRPRDEIDTTTKVELATDAPGEEDLNSFMYQTVGHQLLSHYADLLNVPLYRKRIEGGHVNSNLSYTPDGAEGNGVKGDETEDLLQLVDFIKADFAAKGTTVKAVCSGAILSTYQRTRVESVCSRLGLASIAPLWEKPQLEVLRELGVMGIDARTLKVAAVGLEPGKWLWRNVGGVREGMELKRLGEKWGVHPAGEGGEYETVVVDGPGFRYKVVVEEDDWEGVEVEGGVGYVRLKRFRLEANERWSNGLEDVKVEDLEGLETDLLQPRFRKIYDTLPGPSPSTISKPTVNPTSISYPLDITTTTTTTTTHTTLANIIPSSADLTDFAAQLTSLLAQHNLTTRDISSTLLLLPSNDSFTQLSKLYNNLFPFASPPSRVCVSISPKLLPDGAPFVMHLVATPYSETRKTLHIRSHSNWAPASIGPYSQAVYTPELGIELAGQIGLVPISSTLVQGTAVRDVGLEACLSLQNLYRVARRMRVDCGLEYTPVEMERKQQLDACGDPISDDEDEEEEEREELYLGGVTCYITDPSTLPIVQTVWRSIAPEEAHKELIIVWVEDLPRGAGVEWVAVSQAVEGSIRTWFGEEEVLKEGEDGLAFVRAGEEVVDVKARLVRCWGVWDGEGRGHVMGGWRRL